MGQMGTWVQSKLHSDQGPEDTHGQQPPLAIFRIHGSTLLLANFKDPGLVLKRSFSRNSSCVIPAQELDPAYDHLSGALYSRRQFDRLIEVEHAKLANSKVSPYEAIVAHKTLMIAYARLGRHRESIDAFSQALADYGYKALAEDLREGYALGGYAELGERDVATAELQTMSPSWDVVAWQVGNCFPNLVTLRIEPMWDPLRSDPKFQDLVASMHFPN